MRRLLSLFAKPHLPTLSDYYEPWRYDYQSLITAPAGDDLPTAKPSAQIVWSANWDDSLGGGPELAQHDPVLKSVSERVALEFKQAYTFYLPPICEHCLNPSCVAACPSGAIYKRTEDGIVLVDLDTCRSWRMCVTGCPYKKVFLNHQTGKAEKCTFCFPRIELGMQTVCAQTCVGRLRYIGLVLYDPDFGTGGGLGRGQPVRGGRRPAHPDRLLGRAFQCRRPRAGQRGVAALGRHASLHARHQSRRGAG